MNHVWSETSHWEKSVFVNVFVFLDAQADMEVDIVADMEVDKVVDKEADKVADMVAHASLFLGKPVREEYPGCTKMNHDLEGHIWSFITMTWYDGGNDNNYNNHDVYDEDVELT